MKISRMTELLWLSLFERKLRSRLSWKFGFKLFVEKWESLLSDFHLHIYAPIIFANIWTFLLGYKLDGVITLRNQGSRKLFNGAVEFQIYTGTVMLKYVLCLSSRGRFIVDILRFCMSEIVCSHLSKWFISTYSVFKVNRSTDWNAWWFCYMVHDKRAIEKLKIAS